MTDSIANLTARIVMAMRDEANKDVVSCSLAFGISEEEAKLIASSNLDELVTAAERLDSVFMFRPRVPIKELLSGEESLIFSSLIENAK